MLCAFVASCGCGGPVVESSDEQVRLATRSSNLSDSQPPPKKTSDLELSVTRQNLEGHAVKLHVRLTWVAETENWMFKTVSWLFVQYYDMNGKRLSGPAQPIRLLLDDDFEQRRIKSVEHAVEISPPPLAAWFSLTFGSTNVETKRIAIVRTTRPSS
jgi:hypothetical protein